MAFRQNRKKVRPIRPPAAPTLSQTATERFPTDTTVLPPSGVADQAADMMTPTPMATPGVGELVGQFQEQGAAARAANEARYAQGMGIHEQLVGDFGQGGTLQTAMMGQYQRQKERDLATQKQHMIGSGLMNTTIAAGMPAAYEEQVGTPYKMQMADLMAQRRAGAMQGQAGFIERREDTPPSPELMASMVQTASARPEDVAAGDTTAEGAPTTSTEIAAGGVPNMADVAGQHAFTPPSGKSRSTTMPSMGGGGWGSGLDFEDSMSSGGGGATVREPGRGTGNASGSAPMTQAEGQEVVKKYMGSSKWMVKLADGRTMTNDAYRTLKKQSAGGNKSSGNLADVGKAVLGADAQTGANIGTALGSAFGPLGALAGSLTGTYLGRRNE